MARFVGCAVVAFLGEPAPLQRDPAVFSMIACLPIGVSLCVRFAGADKLVA